MPRRRAAALAQDCRRASGVRGGMDDFFGVLILSFSFSPDQMGAIMGLLKLKIDMAAGAHSIQRRARIHLLTNPGAPM